MKLTLELRDMTQLACLAKALGQEEQDALKRECKSVEVDMHDLLQQVGAQMEGLVSQRQVERTRVTYPSKKEN